MANFPTKAAIKHIEQQRDKYKAEAHLLTQERDTALARIQTLEGALRELTEACEQMITAGEHAWAEPLQRRCFERRENATRAARQALEES